MLYVIIMIMKTQYYNPSTNLVKYLNEELQSLEKPETTSDAEEDTNPYYVRKRTIQNSLARKKNYHINHIFQCFVDILYFFEFIEDHYDKLNNLFEEDIKDLLGFNEDYTKDQF